MSNEYTIPTPRREIFINEVGNRVLNEIQKTYLVEKIDYSDGIKIYYKGGQFPCYGFPTPEAVNAINKVKRLLINSLKLFNTFSLITLFILNYKFTKKIIEWFNNISYEFLYPYLLKDEYLTRPAREIKRVLSDIDPTMATTIAHLIEYDAAYRYRLQDMFYEMDDILFMMNPKREIKRCLNICKKRDHEGVFNKYAQLYKLLYIPKFRKAISKINLKEMSYQDADFYWCCLRGDYNYAGMTYNTRQMYLKNMGYSIPEQYNVKA